jgi:hypothetical protein
MTMIDPAVTVDESPKVTVDTIKEQVSTLEAQVNTLRDTVARERQSVRNLYTQLNDTIQENESDDSDTITYGELSDILASVFGNKLSFLEEYEAEIEFVVRAVAKFKATDSEAAREIADSVELSVDEDDISWNGDGNDEISEIYVDSTRVRSCSEQ